MPSKSLYVLITLTALSMLAGCKKLVSISDPVDRITTAQAFTSDDLAIAAMNGVYFSIMYNGNPIGYVPAYAGLSSDEMLVLTTTDRDPISSNHLFVIPDNGAPTDKIWSWAYNAIYAANAVIEGIAGSGSAQLTDSVCKQLTAEAKCVRAYFYFYLTNFYGDIPLLLSTGYDANILASRTQQTQVYQQILQDLKDAQNDLPADYSFNAGHRTRINKWAATALLARIYLYTKDYNDAATAATAVIGNTGLFRLETDLNSVFLISSQEAIWQINQMITAYIENSTPEGFIFLPQNRTVNTGPVSYIISSQLLNAFEPGDQRKQQWIDSSVFDYFGNGTLGTYYLPYKYKIGGFNRVSGGAAIEYSMALRLAEQYLIRAEAEANGASGGAAAAIADLNVIRHRAGLPDLPDNISLASLTAAIAKERQTELFCEGAHRWFDLKRTGQAHTVLSSIPYKQPWAGDYQLVYPIPIKDMQLDRNLTQNQGY